MAFTVARSHALHFLPCGTSTLAVIRLNKATQLGHSIQESYYSGVQTLPAIQMASQRRHGSVGVGIWLAQLCLEHILIELGYLHAHVVFAIGMEDR
jgi:hypothetical protein